MLGQVIHGYRVDRVLSADKGGFGEVFLATHVDSGAEAVVKVLRAEMSANRDTVTRFFNEARAAASIHHPGIVQIHNVGYHGDRAYLLMERLRGDDLETRIKAGPLPLDRALVFMRQTAGAIAAAHERGIVHRDLKPANLFIVRDPDIAGGERVKVLDFGIAKLTGDAHGVGTTRGIFGTPMYMSPEQCANTGAVDHRSDLYSLGCIFYELVCGQPPFGRGGIELIAAHLRDAPTPPRAIAPWLPPAIEAIILPLLEKQPERRLQSCAALVTALEGGAASAGISIGGARSLPPVSGQGAAVALPTTLGGAAGMMQAPTKTLDARPTRRSIVPIVIGGGVAVAAGVVAIVLATRDGREAEKAVASAPPSAPVDAQVAMASFDASAVVPPVAAPDAGVVIDAVPSAAVADGAHRSHPTAASPDARPSDRDRSDALNEEGKSLLFSNHIAESIPKFQQAIVFDPQPRYYFNLAVAQYSVGDYGNALIAAEVAERAKEPRIAQNARDVHEKIVKQMKAQGMTVPPTR